MKVYISIVDGSVQGIGSTSLATTCGTHGVSYNSAVRGKRNWFKEGHVIEIKEIEIVKIKGRGAKK